MYRIYVIIDNKIPVVPIDSSCITSNIISCSHTYINGYLAFEKINDFTMRCKKCGRIFDIDNGLLFLPIYEEIWQSPYSFDINKIKLQAKQIDSNKFELRIYLNTSDINKENELSHLLNYINSKYMFCLSHIDDSESDYYIYMNIKMQNLKLLVNLLEGILTNTKDKTTKLYCSVYTYLESLKNNNGYLIFDTYNYINQLFGFEKSTKSSQHPYYEDIENAMMQPSVPSLVITTKQEAMALLKQVTLYFKSVIDYCEENNTTAIVVSSTVPHFSDIGISIKAEISVNPNGITSLDVKATNINVYIENEFIIGRRFNTDYGKVADAPMYKLIVTDKLE